ncbi:MAG: hypothetical protein Q8S21_06765 [Candidatus Paracaedibacteraceae bacterium]|nr:hypothetical protein [Candidatus Paracaedibacteraceae bacterium]
MNIITNALKFSVVSMLSLTTCFSVDFDNLYNANAPQTPQANIVPAGAALNTPQGLTNVLVTPDTSVPVARNSVLNNEFDNVFQFDDEFQGSSSENSPEVANNLGAPDFGTGPILGLKRHSSDDSDSWAPLKKTFIESRYTIISVISSKRK